MNIFKIAIGAVLTLWMISCTKEVVPPGNASLTIIHAVVEAEPLRTNFKGTSPIRYSKANLLSYGSFTPQSNRYNTTAKPFSLGLYQQADTLTDSQPLFLFDLDLSVGSIHTLFLTGTADAPESVLVEEKLPFYAAGDSTMGVRFVNLSVGSASVRVNLANEKAGPEVGELAYKEMTGFQRYAVKKNAEDYVFEFRHAETGALIARYEAVGIGNDGLLKPNVWLYRNFTLALIGKLDGMDTEATRILLVSHSE